MKLDVVERINMMIKLSKLKLVLIVLSLLITGCSSNNSISNYELIENAKKEDALIAETNKALMKELMDRQYSNKLYLGDFEAVNAELIPQYIQQLDDTYFSKLGYSYFYEKDIQFYNDSLQRLKNNELSIQEVLESPEKHLRKMDIELYTFIPMKDRSAESLLEFDKHMIKLGEVYAENQVDYEIVWRVYDEDALDGIGFEKIKTLDEPVIPLEQTGLLLNNSLYSNEYLLDYENKSKPYGEIFSEDVVNLNNKFNEEFIYLGNDSIEDNADMFAPIDDLSVEFEAIGSNDAYLTLIAQKKLSDEIYKIIEEEGAKDYIGAFVIGNDFEKREFSSKSIDMSEPIDNIKFLNDIFPYKYDVSLIYMTSNEEDIDYAILKNISSKINLLLSRYHEGDETMKNPINLFVDFYILEDESEIRLAIKLLYENRLTDRWLGYKRGLAYLYADMYIRRSETEAFHYLDVYGEKLNYILVVFIDPSDFSVEEFSRRLRKSSEF